MKTITVTKWSVPAILAALLAVFALATISTQSASAVGHEMPVSVKQASLADHADDCPGGIMGAHFVITQIAAGPATIEVYYEDGSSETVPLAKQSGTVAHYNATSGGVVVDAVALVPSTWTGQFNLSNYICGPSSSTSSTPTS